MAAGRCQCLVRVPEVELSRADKVTTDRHSRRLPNIATCTVSHRVNSILTLGSLLAHKNLSVSYGCPSPGVASATASGCEAANPSVKPYMLQNLARPSHGPTKTHDRGDAIPIPLPSQQHPDPC